MHNNTDWNDYHFFLRVAQQGSLKAAAQVLGVNHSTVFRRINALEKKMQTRLFKRLKTGYVLTEAGEQVLSRVQQMEEELHAVERKLLGKDIRLSGILKISTTDTLGYYWLPPYIKQFKEQYGDIIIDVIIKTSYTNLTKREADIVIPAVNRQPDYMVGRKLTPISFRLYASKEYAKQHGRLQTINDFPKHRFLLPNESLAGLPANRWLRSHIPPHLIAATSDKLTGLYKMAKMGLGVAPLPQHVGDWDHLMVNLMELPESLDHNVWILTHPDLRHTARVKAFMQFMYNAVKNHSIKKRDLIV